MYQLHNEYIIQANEVQNNFLGVGNLSNSKKKFSVQKKTVQLWLVQSYKIMYRSVQGLQTVRFAP